MVNYTPPCETSWRKVLLSTRCPRNPPAVCRNIGLRNRAVLESEAKRGTVMCNCRPNQLPSLTEDIATASIRDFFRNKPFLFFGTGMSCAMNVRFGTNTLKDELTRKIGEPILVAGQNRQWQPVSRSLQRGVNLELSLNFHLIDYTGTYTDYRTHGYPMRAYPPKIPPQARQPIPMAPHS